MSTPHTTSPTPVPAADGRVGAGGRWLVTGLIGLGLAAAATGILFQRQQTRRCLAFYGPAAARRITAAPEVSLAIVRPSGRAGTLQEVVRRDIAKAAGLVHLRRGLVEDANFAWSAQGPAEPLEASEWDYALEFADGSSGPTTTLVVDLDPAGGHVAVVGSPGRVPLGRLGPGLAKWLRSTLEPPAEQDAGAPPPAANLPDFREKP